MRLARFLARAGVSSRRGAADLLKTGRVGINGRPATGPGDPVDPARDVVTVDGRRIALAGEVWLALNKPLGYATSRRATGRHAAVFDLLEGAPRALVPVGRLDVLSEGLLLFTTDGELAARLMHPRWKVPRVYRVEVTRPLDRRGREALNHGVRLEEGPVRPSRWRFTPAGKGGLLELELAEGRSRVVRRVCASLGLGIRRLVRVAYGPVRLGGLKVGRARGLSPGELAALYRCVLLSPPARNTDNQ
jgi:pseudouridine synthase